VLDVTNWPLEKVAARRADFGAYSSTRFVVEGLPKRCAVTEPRSAFTRASEPDYLLTDFFNISLLIVTPDVIGGEKRRQAWFAARRRKNHDQPGLSSLR
jgi:hypothetical protein